MRGMNIDKLKNKVLNGGQITKEEALFLAEGELNELACAADEIRRAYCKADFDMCAVMSVKGGRCSENCRFREARISRFLTLLFC